MSNIASIKQKIIDEAKTLGFYRCGFSKVRELAEEKKHFSEYLNKAYNAEMSYLEKNFEKRLHPGKLVENSKTVISLLFPYYPNRLQKNNVPQISKYTYGEDYHLVIKEKLHMLIEFIYRNVSLSQARAFVDSAPVLEKKWAQLSGLGWIGKNTNLITKKGSYFFISEIISDLDADEDLPMKNYCGTCKKCIDACPTNALVEPYVLDSRKCISYLTIENKKEISKQFKGKFNNYIFGCDICQDVCPYNKKPIKNSEIKFEPSDEFLEKKIEDWKNLTKDDFNRIFKKSAVKRTKYTGLKRNLDFVFGNNEF